MLSEGQRERKMSLWVISTHFSGLDFKSLTSTGFYLTLASPESRVSLERTSWGRFALMDALMKTEKSHVDRGVADVAAKLMQITILVQVQKNNVCNNHETS